MVEREIGTLDVQSTNFEQLQDVIITSWTHIPKEYFRNNVDSIPRRIEAVLKVKGSRLIVLFLTPYQLFAGSLKPEIFLDSKNFLKMAMIFIDIILLINP